MVFSHKSKQSLDISLDGEKIEQTEKERFLGVIIDSGLNWSHHINILASKVSRNSGILYRLKGIVPHTTLKLVIP